MFPLASFVARSAWETLRRFPGPLLAGAVSGALLIDAQHHDFRGEEPLRFALAASLGLPLGIALALVAERPPRFLEKGWLASLSVRRVVAFLLTAVLVAAYAAGLHLTRGEGDSYILRFAQLSVAAHLAVVFAPYLSRSEATVQNGVWQLSSQLFLRLPVSIVYAAVAFGGLSLALAAGVQLFDLEVNEDRYFELWVMAAFVLQTWHLLAGIPRDFDALGQNEEYPRGLRIFAQFILLPLLGLYLVILYAYALKIIVTGHLPNQWVGWLVSGAGGFGMLSLLLLFPAREGAGGRFVRAVETTFHVAILPLLGLLFFSLSVRVDAYGITERRYFLGVLGLWLALASLYRLKWGRRRLTWIPLSLCLVAALTSFGPWGAVAVARENQAARLTEVLVRTGRLEGPGSGEPVSVADRRRMSRILDYLVEAHGKSTLRRWPGPKGPSETPTEFLHVRGVAYLDRYQSNTDAVYFNGRGDLPLEVDGYDWLVPFVLYRQTEWHGPPSRFEVRLAKDEPSLDIVDGGAAVTRISLAPVLAELEASPRDAKEAPQPFVLTAEAQGFRMRVILTQLQAERREASWAVESASGDLLIGQ